MDLDKILNEKSVHFFRKGYITLKGYTLTTRYQDIKEDLNNVEVDERDVWICTFPKTGTTWTQEMVWMIRNNLDFEGAKENLEYRSPFVDFSVVYDDRDMIKSNPNYNSPPFIHDSVGFYKKMKSPKVVKTHLPYDLLPLQIIDGIKKPKLIYVARNPKDTCVSYYHHSKFLEGFRGEFEEFCQLFLGGKVLYGPYLDHVLSYWKHRNSQNILFLKYEDMKKDLPKSIVQVAQFLDRPLSKEQVEILTNHLSFESMKQNNAVNKEIVAEMNRQWDLTDDPNARFMRSGKVGDHKNAMSQEMIKKFDKWIANKLEGTGYQF